MPIHEWRCRGSRSEKTKGFLPTCNHSSHSTHSLASLKFAYFNKAAPSICFTTTPPMFLYAQLHMCCVVLVPLPSPLVPSLIMSCHASIHIPSLSTSNELFLNSTFTQVIQQLYSDTISLWFVLVSRIFPTHVNLPSQIFKDLKNLWQSWSEKSLTTFTDRGIESWRRQRFLEKIKILTKIFRDFQRFWKASADTGITETVFRRFRKMKLGFN